MTLTELSTAAQFNIGVKILILNNEEQGKFPELSPYQGNPCQESDQT